jgi:HAD superfamily hydrolase (TIGR01509 family)
MIKAVIFDMDGLIVDTETIHSHAAEKLLKTYGKQPQYLPNGLLHIIGESGDRENNRFINLYELPIDSAQLRNQRRAFFEDLIEEKLTPLPGFMHLLKLLHKQKYKIALASNRYEKHIHMILDNLEVTEYFDVIVGPNDERRHKPHPDIYLHTVEKLNVKPDECIVLEDSEPGILAAKAANMKVIAIPNQYTAEQDLTKADIILDSLDKVNVNLIESL